MRYLTSTEPLEVGMMAAVARRRLELAAEEREDLAIRIANNVSRAIFGG